MQSRNIPRWLGPAALVGWFGLLLWGERRSRLRRPVEDKLTHDARNLAVAGASAAVIQGLEMPVVRPLAKLVERRRWGLTRRLPIPEAARDVLAVILMDYTLYLWHVLTHRVPLGFERWLAHLVVTPRLHGIHHSTRDEEVNSNWSSGLTVWDWLHGTLRTEVPQEEITIGVPGFDQPEQVTLPKMLALPFLRRN